MILPIVSSISRELFLGVPHELKEGALALGTTRWEMVRGVMFPYARGGIAAALILGLGRAIGEAIAVTQVIGGSPTIQWNLFFDERHAREQDRRDLPGRSRRSSSGASLIELGLILLVFSLAREHRRPVDRASHRTQARHHPRRARVSTHELSGPAMRLDRLPRRRAVNRLMEALAWLSAAIAVAILGIVVWSVGSKGWSELNLNLLTRTPIPFSLTNAPQGLSNAFAGTIVIVGLATAMALPVGILDRDLRQRVRAGVDSERCDPGSRRACGRARDRDRHLRLRSARGREWAKRARRARSRSRSSCCRSSRERRSKCSALVPNSLREASLGLGIPQWRTTLSIVLPRAIGGILTGTVLAVARVAGEAAPLLFTSSVVGTATNWNPVHALQTIPVAIFELSRVARPRRSRARLGGSASFCSCSSCSRASGARWLVNRSRRKILAPLMEGAEEMSRS